jgi:putative hydrolase of the HAD superfamily
MRQNISAVAFDVDGTLYPNYRFYLRVLPQAVSHPFLLAAFYKARKKIRRTGAVGNSFYDIQAALCAKELKAAKKDGGAGKIKSMIETRIYSAWEKLFLGIKLYPHVKASLDVFRESGFKLAVLSDFPLGLKLKYLGLGGIWDAELCSEEIGALKPDPLPFRCLAEKLGLPPERILYVGNSPAYDIAGARNVGMATALRRPRPWVRGGGGAGSGSSGDSGASTGSGSGDGTGNGFTFDDYRQLQEYVLR